MTKRFLPVLFGLLIVASFAWTIWFLYDKSNPEPVAHATAPAERRDLVKKTVAPGAILPRREVVIKPRVSGVIEELYVEAGQQVGEKELLAKIRIIPNAVSLNQAEAALASAKISFETAQRELERFHAMRGEGVVAQTELIDRELTFRLRQQELEAAENNLQIIRIGASKKSGVVSNLVYSTVSGMVLDVPVKEGGSVIEANNFNEGTTIASIADMKDMVFEGRVDESEVGRLEIGMPVRISVGAFPDRSFDGVLEHIAPKGLEKSGTIEFAVRAKVRLEPGVFVRANYSANADIILERRDRALSVNEAWVLFEHGKSYVEVEGAPRVFEKREVRLGLSDGIWSEVTHGLSGTEKIKRQEAEGPRP